MLGRQKKTGTVPEGQRLYAIGDIHGCASELDALMEKIDAENDDATTQLVFLGDYVDRGPDSKAVIEHLIAIKKSHPNSVFLKGNHEAAMLDFLRDPEDMYQWLDWGGEETLESYGLSSVRGRVFEELAEELREAMPAAHVKFLNSLELTYQAGDYYFVHAGIRPGVALEDQDEEDLLWIRKRFHNASKAEQPEPIIVHGHQPMKKPLDAGWRIAVDTGACWSGMLTAVVLEGKTRRFLST